MLKKSGKKLFGKKKEENLTEEQLQIMRQVKMQKTMKWLGVDGCFGIQYDIPLFFKKTPEELEAKRQAEIAELKHILEEYQVRMEEEEKLRQEEASEKKPGKNRKRRS